MDRRWAFENGYHRRATDKQAASKSSTNLKPKTRLVIRLAVKRLVLGTLLLVLAGCAQSNFGMPPSGSANGPAVHNLWRLFVVVAGAVGAVVWGLIAWSVIAYRRRSEELPKQTHFNIPIEVAYTAIPVVIVIFLFATTLSTLAKTERLSSRPDLVIEATSFQWQWRFHYPDRGVDVVGQTNHPAEMVLPAGATVRIVLTSADVIHAFFVPEFVVKHDAIPGRRTTFDIKATRPGVFDSGRCTVFCGLNHDRMTFSVKVLSRSEFESWMAANQTARTPG